MEEAIRLYEGFQVLESEIKCEEKQIKEYAATESIHSSVTDWAYGKIIARKSYNISDGSILKAKFNVPNTSYRFKIKINACLENWKKYYNDITILVNGNKVIEQDDVFLENVMLGWPSVYFNVKSKYFVQGENIVEVFTKNTNEGGLIVSQVKLIIYPEFKELNQVSFRKYCKEGCEFGVAVYDSNHIFKGVESKNCTFNKSRYFGDFCVMNFTSNKGKCSAKAIFGKRKIKLILPNVIEKADNFFIGIDSDDHRHDNSEEMERIITSSIFTDMVDFIQFRPHQYRNYIHLSSREVFEERIDFMDCFGVKYGIAGTEGFFADLPVKKNHNFVGYHMHELYHFFNFTLEGKEYFGKNMLLNFPGLRASKSFAESKQLYYDYLIKTKSKISNNIGSTSIGAPSLLCVYEGDVGFDRITIEPVSNLNILTGVVRATSVKTWGAHIPTDWYFGVPVDVCKSNKFLLSMQYLYLNGAAYLYAENSLFKTNAFDRLDFEDEHCVTNRKYLRDFYHYTMTHPRKGELIVDKAFIFGRNEFLMWQTNDRMGELKERDWDEPVWGKWDNSYQKCWQATKSWLPFASKQETARTPLNTNLFSGTPYGNVDVVYADKDFTKYKMLAFLGWNTMNEELFEKLKKYVNGGGNLVISYCHFNTVDRNDLPFEFLSNEAIEKFTGVKIGEEFIPSTRAEFNDMNTYLIKESDGLNCIKCNPTTSKMICKDKLNNGIIFENKYGKGKVYFVTFKEYFSKDWAVDTVAHLLDIVGSEGDYKCDNKNITFTIRKVSDKKLDISVLNMNCVPNSTENFMLKVFEKEISDTIKVNEIKNYQIEI